MEKEFLSFSQTFIIDLLKAEIKSTKLIRGLESAGLHPEDFHLGISTEILKLIGFDDAENDDGLHDFYFAELEKICNRNMDDFFEKLTPSAVELYQLLLKMRDKKES